MKVELQGLTAALVVLGVCACALFYSQVWLVCMLDEAYWIWPGTQVSACWSCNCVSMAWLHDSEARPLNMNPPRRWGSAAGPEVCRISGHMSSSKAKSAPATAVLGSCAVPPARHAARLPWIPEELRARQGLSAVSIHTAPGNIRGSQGRSPACTSPTHSLTHSLTRSRTHPLMPARPWPGDGWQLRSRRPGGLCVPAHAAAQRGLLRGRSQLPGSHGGIHDLQQPPPGPLCAVPGLQQVLPSIPKS